MRMDDPDDLQPTDSLLRPEQKEYSQRADDTKRSKSWRFWTTRNGHFLVLYLVNGVLTLVLSWYLMFPRDPTLALFCNSSTFLVFIQILC